jgi:hypothetical protein
MSEDSSSVRTRSRTRQAGTPPISQVDHNLPSPRPRRKATKPVSPPLTSTRLHTLIYVLVLLSSLLALYYSYRITQWKTQAGGWWNFAVGKPPPQIMVPQTTKWNWRGWSGRRESSRQSETVEDRINALASVLGMPSNELASAIAIAVREYVPPATLSSIAAKETGTIVKMLVKGVQDHEAQKVAERTKVKSESENGKTTGVVEGVVNGMGSFVGMDEPL